MREKLEGVSLLLILTLGFLADGIMEACGPAGFILASAITLTAAEALHIIAGAKKESPLYQHRPKRDTRDSITKPRGLVQPLYHGPSK